MLIGVNSTYLKKKVRNYIKNIYVYISALHSSYADYSLSKRKSKLRV